MQNLAKRWQKKISFCYPIGHHLKADRGDEPLIKSEKTSTHSKFEINMERFGGSWFSVTHPHDLKSQYAKSKIRLKKVNCREDDSLPNVFYYSQKC